MPKKRVIEETVYEAALKRFDILFQRFDRVVVSFSGGKDSTVCLNLALEAARKHGRLPLEVYFFDEEAVHPETIEYCERVRALPDIDFKWLCVPIRHRNACSRHQPYWHPWDPAKRELWVRPMPDGALTTFPGFTFGASMPDVAPLVYGPERGTVADVRGLRADESIRRFQAVTRTLKEGWLGQARLGYSHPASPIYDWTTIDVWTAPRLYDWDWNRTYALMELAGVPPSVQRVCPPYGEEPLRGLWLYATCWPDLWEKMIARVRGAATAARYAKTELYGYGTTTKPDGFTWQSWTMHQIESYPKAYRGVVSNSLRSMIRTHQSKTRRPIPEELNDPMSGLSWKFLSGIVLRGDMKGRRAGSMVAKAQSSRKKSGLTMEEITEYDIDTRY